MRLEELFDFKNQLMKDLCSNEKIVRLVTGNDKARVPNHDLPYTQIYPYRFIPETVKEGKTFICMDVDIEPAYYNSALYLPNIYIWILTHKSQFRTKEGVLQDLIASEVHKMLQDNRNYGLGELKLYNCQWFEPITDYLGRSLIYNARDLNLSEIKNSRNLPANRKPNRYNGVHV